MIVGTGEAVEAFEGMRVSKAPSLHPSYLLADAERDASLKPHFFVYRRNDACFYHPFHLQAIPDSDWLALQSAYGYGGPLVDGGDADFLRAAYSAWFDWSAEARVLVEFIRFHPFLKNQRYYHCDAHFNRETVPVDLTAGDVLTDAFKTRARTATRKALKEGLRVVWSQDADDWAIFQTLYESTMSRLSAKTDFFFPSHYYQALADWKGCELALCMRGEEVLAAALFLFSGGVMEYHLSAASDEGRRLAATNLLLLEAARRGQAQGLEVLHLGGGNDQAADNPLLSFKSGFSSRRAAFHIGCHIYEPAPYEALKTFWQHEHGTCSDRILYPVALLLCGCSQQKQIQPLSICVR